MRKNLIALLPLAALLMSCKHHNPVQDIHSDATSTPPSGITNPSTPPSTNNLVIYGDSLSSGGGAFEYPDTLGSGSLDFADTSNPIGVKSIKFFWGGQPVGGQTVFAGFDLMHVGDQTQYNVTPGKNLQSGSYKHVAFQARGSLQPNNVIKIEVADDGDTNTPAPCIVLSANGTDTDAAPGVPHPCLNTAKLSSTWQPYNLSVSNSDLASVKDYFKATFINKGAGTAGGTVYFDSIQYEP